MPDTETRDQAESAASSDSFAVELWRRWLGYARTKRAGPDRARADAYKYVKGGEHHFDIFKAAKWEGAKATANYLYPTLKVLLPHLIPRHPRGLLIPGAAASDDVRTSIAVLEEKLSYDWREGRYLRQIEKAVNEALIGGIGWVRASWDKERQIPELKHVKPTRMLVDPEAEEELSEAGWVAEQVTMRVADVKASDFFMNAHRLKPETFGTNYAEEGKNELGDTLTLHQKDMLSTVRLWFIWSRRGEGRPAAPAEEDQEEALGDNVLLVYAEGHDFWLHKGPWPLAFDHDEFPYRCLRFNYDPEKFLSYGPMQPAMAVQKFLNWQVSFLVQHTKKGACAKIIYDKSMVTSDQLARIFNGVDYEGIGVDFLDGGKTPFHVVDLQTDPTKIENTIQIAKQMLFDITGAAELIMGGQGKTQSATEADIRERRAQNRIDDMRDQVKDFLIDINRAITMIEVLKTPVRTEGGKHGIDFFLGDAAIEPWKAIEKLTPEQMRAEIMFDVDAGTMRRPTREQQIQDLFGLWDRLAGMYATNGQWGEVQKLLARVVKVLELPDSQELVPDQMGPVGPSPEEMQAQQQAQEQNALAVRQQEQQQLQQAFQQIQQAMEQLKMASDQGDMALRQEMQAAIQGFQAALVASGQNMAAAMGQMAQQTVGVAQQAAAQGLEAGATTGVAGMVGTTAAQGVQQAAMQAQEAIGEAAQAGQQALAETVQAAQESVERDLEEINAPVKFEVANVRWGPGGRLAGFEGTMGGNGSMPEEPGPGEFDEMDIGEELE